MRGGGIRSSKLGKAARKMVEAAYACGSLTRRKSLSISGSSVLSTSKPNTASEEDEEIEIAEQTEFKTNNGLPLPDKNLCPICLDPLNYKSKGRSAGQAIFTAQCSHAFHLTCISSNVRHGSVTCPICRAHWTQLPRNLKPPSSSIQTDPILQILDNSIATLRIHRRSSVLSAYYDDDDPIEPCFASNHSRLLFSLSISTSPPSIFHHPPLGRPTYSQLFPSFSKSSAYLSVKLSYWRATDLVLVACPNGPHLRLLKQAMAMVVFSLRTNDRLAIVTYYSSSAARVFPLRRMTSYGKRAALQVIDRLFYMGHADPVEGIKKASKILEDRTHKNPHFSILHMSDCPTRSYHAIDLETSIPIHLFYVGCGLNTSNGFIMHELEEFLANLLGGVIRDVQLRVGEEGGSRIIRLGELRGDEERRILIDNLSESGHVTVKYSYVESELAGRITTGETVIGIGNGNEGDVALEAANRREVGIGGRSSNVESLYYHDLFMTRRWAKHLRGYKL